MEQIINGPQLPDELGMAHKQPATMRRLTPLWRLEAFRRGRTRESDVARRECLRAGGECCVQHAAVGHSQARLGAQAGECAGGAFLDGELLDLEFGHGG